MQEGLGHTFADEGLLIEALTHRSYMAEQELDTSYERLEFLGDAVLQLAITHYLYEGYPTMAEGEMAKVRAAVVNEAALAEVGRSFDMGPALLLGRGEELSGGRDKDSILSDVVEAVLGAVYLEAGFTDASRIVRRHWQSLVDDRASDPGKRDYKTRLQEHLARTGLKPRYEITDSGPEHDKHFKAAVWVDGRLIGTGEGSSKKRAEQQAARLAGERLVTGDA